MATRESQALQIALILCVMVVIALGVTTFIFYNKSVTAEKRESEEKAKALAVQKQNDVLKFQNELLKWMVGFNDLQQAEIEAIDRDLKAKDEKAYEEIAKIRAEFEEDVKLFQASQAALGAQWTEPQNWATLPDYLVAVIQKKNLEWKNEQERAQKAENDKNTQVKAEVAKTRAAEKGQQDAHNNYLAAKADFDKARADFLALADDLQKKLTDKNVEIKRVTDEAAKSIKTLEQQYNTVVQLNQGYREELEKYKSPEYDAPHGEIRWVNQAARSVYINLGRADGLRRQMTFSVYDRDAANVAAVPKGKIEVTRIVDDHLAEARILEDQVANPIMPGDFIYTPAWSPGRRLHFALAGFMDINGDGKSDRQLIRNLITLNGGEIDAEVTDTGEFVGKLTPGTRYLVLGERPTETTNPELIRSYTQIIKNAQELGVETVDVMELLDRMGYRGEVRTVGLGRRAAAESEGGSPFPKRTPPGSAYRP